MVGTRAAGHDGQKSKIEHCWIQHNRQKSYHASVCIWLPLALIGANIWHAPYYFIYGG